MIGHLKNKPSKEKILEAINDAAKIEFDFILNGLNVDLIGIEPEEVILLIDKKTKELKNNARHLFFFINFIKFQKFLIFFFIKGVWLLWRGKKGGQSNGRL